MSKSKPKSPKSGSKPSPKKKGDKKKAGKAKAGGKKKAGKAGKADPEGKESGKKKSGKKPDKKKPGKKKADKQKAVVNTSKAPAPVGAYPHARKVGKLLFLSGVGPRQAGTNAIPGGPIVDAEGKPRDYDAKAQTRATIENIKAILEASGSRLEDVVDVTSFLVDMKRDFAAYNEVYCEYFGEIQATRTTLAITALPTPIAVELKVIARPR